MAQEMGARLAAGEILLGRVSKGHTAWARCPDWKALNPQGAIGATACCPARSSADTSLGYLRSAHNPPHAVSVTAVLIAVN